MAKRENRIRPIEHEQRQLANLKTLQPNTTPPESQTLSDALIDIAIEALKEVAVLESGQPPALKRLQRLVEMVDRLPDMVK